MLIVFLLAALQSVPAVNDAQRLYIVGSNDVLTITVYNQAQLSGKFVVEADGTFAYPLLGRVAAGGLSIRAVEDKVRQGLADGFLKDPQITVTVDQYRSQQIFVMGEVKQPGPLQFTGSMTLIEALARAGSVTDRAGTEALIVHSDAGGAAVPAPIASASTARGDALRIDLLSRIRLAQRVDVTRARLMDDARAESSGEQRQRLRHAAIDRRCAEAAADDEQRQRPRASREPGLRRRHANDGIAHRVADPFDCACMPPAHRIG